MRWSQLKKRIEDNFAVSVQGRVEVWTTRYRNALDQEGEAWISFDGKRAISMATFSYELEASRTRVELRAIAGSAGFRNTAYPTGDHSACEEAALVVKREGQYPLWDFNRSLFDYLNLSIDDALQSTDPLIKALGMLDRRFGKRRLKEFDQTQESVLVKKLYEFRCSCEGIAVTG